MHLLVTFSPVEKSLMFAVMWVKCKKGVCWKYKNLHFETDFLVAVSRCLWLHWSDEQHCVGESLENTQQKATVRYFKFDVIFPKIPGVTEINHENIQ